MAENPKIKQMISFCLYVKKHHPEIYHGWCSVVLGGANPEIKDMLDGNKGR